MRHHLLFFATLLVLTRAWVPSSRPRIRSELLQLHNAETQSSSRDPQQLELIWCGEQDCRDVLREKVVGHEILLTGPATGQVAYYWNSETAKRVSTLLLLVKPGDEELLKTAADAIRELRATTPVQILLEPSTAARLKHHYDVETDRLFEATPTPGYGNDLRLDAEADRTDGTSPDLIVTIGGDGLLMHAAMIFQGPSPPILCVSGGSLGFLTPFPKQDMVPAIRAALGLSEETSVNDTTNGAVPETTNGAPKFVRTNQIPICLSIRMRLDCQIQNRDGTVRARYNVLNEVVIDRGSSPYLAALECFCDDAHLTTVQADGIIFATPTGSTAYSMAAGGSVVHPAVPCILVTPICPHVLSFRSMVFPDHVVLRCYVPDDARAEASVAFDGKHRQELRRGDSVKIELSGYPVPTINRVNHSEDWLGSLKRNFNFNTRPRQRPLNGMEW